MQLPLPQDGRHRPVRGTRWRGLVGRTRVAATVLLAAVLAAVTGVALTAAGAAAGAAAPGPATPLSIDGHVGAASSRVTALVDGVAIPGDPRPIRLREHDAVQLEVGAPIPFHPFTFPAGL